MVINTNIAAQTGSTLLAKSSQLLAKSLSRLSSGSKIVSPEDDAAGLAVSMRFGAQINRTQAAMNNLGNALSFSQTQDGYLAKVNDALDRMSELSVLAQDSTKTNGDRSLYNTEFQSLTSYVNDVATKDFNGVSLFSGTAINVSSDADGGSLSVNGISANYVAIGVTTTSYPSAGANLGSISSKLATTGSGQIHVYGSNGSGTKTFQSSDSIQSFVDFFNGIGNGIGASYNSSNGQLSITLPSGNTLDDNSDIIGYMGFNTGNSVWIGGSPLRRYNGNGANTAQLSSSTTTSTAMDISTTSGAASALTQIKSSISQLATDRANIGSSIERINYNIEQLGTLKNNLSAASSRITDVDVAQESTNYARANILVQAGTSMLAQANSTPQSVLKLLG